MADARSQRTAPCVAVGIVCLGLALHARDAAGWLVSLPNGTASTVAIDAAGNAIAGRLHPGVGTNLALAVAVAPNGAIVAAGRLGGVASSDFAIVQLDGTSGELTP